MTAATFVLDPLLPPADADAVVDIVEQFPGYGLYAVEKSASTFAADVPQRIDAVMNHVRSGQRAGRAESPDLLVARTNYLRETFAYGDDVRAPGIERLWHHEGLAEAARELFGRPVIEPAIVYANILLPGQELAVHTDVPEFRGANRKVTPQWLIVVMHQSGLFEPWRMPIATAVTYFGRDDAGRPDGGALAYWPEGPDGEVHRLATGHNTGILLDTDSVYHGVERLGPPHAVPPTLRAVNVLEHDGAEWQLRPARGSTETLATWGWDEIRVSLSWKAYCFADEAERTAWRTNADDLTVDVILDRLRADLAERGVGPVDDLADADLARLLIDTYQRYPQPVA